MPTLRLRGVVSREALFKTISLCSSSVSCVGECGREGAGVFTAEGKGVVPEIGVLGAGVLGAVGAGVTGNFSRVGSISVK